MRSPFFICLGLLLALGQPALGQGARALEPKLPSTPALLKADRVSYDEDLGLVVANGHVEISQEDRILLADTVTYNQRTDTITASGNVSLLEPSGDVVFANFFELTQGLKEGVAQNFRLLMKDHSRFAAAGARREGGTLTEMVKGVYSPCELCKEDPERAPLWQIKAARIVHDEEEHEVYYEDATLEMAGIPVAYSPYFSHPDPTVRRKSGLLAPTYGQDSRIGTLIRIPYFWVIGPDKDITIAPIFTTRGGQVFDTQYRERWGSGKIDLEGSIVDAPARDINGNSKAGSQLRGHFNGNGIFNLDRDWRTGFDIQRESDQTFLRVYKVLPKAPTVLPANAYVEGFFGRSYNSLNAYTFQDTRSSVNVRTLPVVAPIYQFNYESEAGSYGQRWTTDASALNLFRPSGVNSRRLSQRTQWELPYTSSIGDLYSLTLSMETDGYATTNNIDPSNPSAFRSQDSAGRVLPQAKFEWRYPWVRQDGTVQELIEPRAAFITGPNGRNTFLIPNEDSLDFEFDEENLFRLNSFPGVDRVDGGNRVIYGATVGAYGSKGGTANLFFGQRYRFHKDDTFSSDSGLRDNLSDYVGRLQIKPMRYFDLLYRFRLAHGDLSPNRSEISASAGTSALTVNANYVSLTQEVPGKGLIGIEQIALSATSKLTDYWSVGANGVRNVNDGRFRNLGLHVTYNDECFLFTTTVARNIASDRDVQPSTTFLVQLVFKHLGEVRLGASGGGSGSRS